MDVVPLPSPPWAQQFSPWRLPGERQWVIISTEISEEQSPEKLNHLPAITQWSPEEKKLGRGSPSFQPGPSFWAQAGPGCTDTPDKFPLCSDIYMPASMGPS